LKSRKKKLATAMLLAGVVILAAFTAGCFGGDDDNVKTIKIAGSTTVQPIATKCSEAYMKDHKNVDIQVSGGGSSVGVKSVGEGTVDIGMASRDMKDSEKSSYPGLVQHVVARDGIAVIVHKTNSIVSLTETQVRGIYNGTYTNWKNVGGPDLTIVVINRDSASGTREFFYDHVMKKEDFVSTAQEMNSNGAVKSQVESTPGAIGYVGLGYVDNKIKAIKIDTGAEKVDPTVANVVNGKYPIARNLNMFTKGQPTGLAKDFINFILSSEGQKLVEEEGFVPLK
jgi:phosphate transport system substrate-binding protein